MSGKLRVLHVVGAMNRAGTETMLMNIFRHIDREKVHFDFVSYSGHDADYDQEIKQLGGRVIKLSKTNSIKEIYQVIKKNGPYDVVHAHTLFHCGIAVIAARLAGVKVRISHAHTTLDETNGFIRKVYMNLMRRMIKLFSTNLLACSNGAGSYLFGKNGINKQVYSYFPNVIEYSRFLVSPEAKVKTFKMEQGFGKNIVIGHIGRFIEAKNHTFLLEIMQHIIRKDPTSKLLLVGDGELRREMEATAKQRGIYDNVRFVGIRKDVATMFHSMDVFVFPSHYEGLGLVLLEAQASGIPSIVSENIQPEADLQIGLITRITLADGPEAWADRIIELVNMKKRNTAEIIDGFERGGYSLSKAISALMNIYQSKPGGAYERNTDYFL